MRRPARWLCLAALVLALAGCQDRFSPASARELVERWAQTVQSGKNGDQYWENPSLANRLGAIRSCKVLFANETGDKIVMVSARLDCSPTSGEPNIATWDFQFSNVSGSWKISSITPRSAP